MEEEVSEVSLYIPRLHCHLFNLSLCVLLRLLVQRAPGGNQDVFSVTAW